METLNKNSPLTWHDVERMATLLRENKVNPPYMLTVHPLIWNGYWFIQEKSKLFRWLGRKLHSRRVYWLGLRVKWISGLKDFIGE